MQYSQLLFSFQGRLNRQPYWLTVLAMVGVILVVVLIVFALAAAVGGRYGAAAFLLVILYIPFLWAGLAIGVKRLHDRDKSGWWLVLFWLVPGLLQGIGEQIRGFGFVLILAGLAISIWGLVEIGFLRGTQGPNQYGPDPLEGQA